MANQAVATAATKEKMDKGSALAYSIGFGGTNVVWYMINNYLMLFYTDVVTLSAGAISAILLIARIWDAVNDPMMGAIVDRTNTKWGKFKPYIVMGAPFLAIFNVLTFTVYYWKEQLKQLYVFFLILVLAWHIQYYRLRLMDL